MYNREEPYIRIPCRYRIRINVFYLQFSITVDIETGITKFKKGCGQWVGMEHKAFVVNMSCLLKCLLLCI
jgi:hypothetical protein